MGEKQDVWAFQRVIRRIGKLSACAVPTKELSRGALFCMGAICHDGVDQFHQEGIYVWELVERTHLHPPAVSRTLRELEGKGLIERSVDPSDRRNVKVRPTSKGLAFHERAEAKMGVILCQAENKMGADNIAQLVDLCDRLCDIMEEEHARYDQSSKET